MAITTGQQVADEARKWLGTPYAEQGRVRSIGLDCGGLILVVGRALGLTELEELGYRNSPDGERFEALLDQECIRVDPKEAVSIGHILAIDYGHGIQHTGFVTGMDPKIRIIHAMPPPGQHSGTNGRGVIEQFLAGRQKRGWVRTYAVKGVVYE